jgi:mannose-6-phosphate isomerase-like protein (cupin superfamily)
VKAQIVKVDEASEFMTSELCAVVEAWNDESDPAVSIARARVTAGTTTQLHRLDVDERYLIISGRGEMELDNLTPQVVERGDVVVIPAGTPQRIRNLSDTDLVFYCICSPRFRPSGYEPLS